MRRLTTPLIIVIFIIVSFCCFIFGILSQQPKIRVLETQVTELAQVVEEGTIMMREAKLVLIELQLKLKTLNK